MKSLTKNISLNVFPDFYTYMEKFNFFIKTPEFEHCEDTGFITIKTFSKNSRCLITVLFSGNGQFTITHSSLDEKELGAKIFSLTENKKEDLDDYIQVYSDFEISENQITKAIITALEKQGIENNDALKIEKLFYLCQGVSLVHLNETIIPNCEFEAWQDGPRLNNLFHKLKYFGSLSISSQEPIWNFTKDLPEESPQKNIIEKVVDSYKSFSTEELIQMSKTKDSPWRRAIEERITVIPNDSIKKHFKTFVKSQN